MNVDFRNFGGDIVARVTRRWFKLPETFVRKELAGGGVISWTSDTTGREYGSGRNRYNEPCDALGLAIEARYQAHLRGQLDELAEDMTRDGVPPHYVKR